MNKKRVLQGLLVLLMLSLSLCIVYSQDDNLDFKKGKLLYRSSLGSPMTVSSWKMEGPGKLEFKDRWMHMYSPGEKFHHVFWCPENFPESFIAEWEVQRVGDGMGLCIVFFAAKGKNGEDIFDPSFPERDGTFGQYTKSDYFNTYHISYYANAEDAPGRGISHLRKNSGFHLVQHGEMGVPLESKERHKVTLVKAGPRIIMLIDDREIIDWTDDGKEYGPVLQDGKIGLRQMQWTHFRYRNFRVYELK